MTDKSLSATTKGGFLKFLPTILKELLPFGSSMEEVTEKEIAPQSIGLKKRKPAIGWEDVVFIHSMPGEDEDDGLLILGDGSMRKAIKMQGVTAALFDEKERGELCRRFARLVDALNSDIQIIVNSRNVPVADFLMQNQKAGKKENDYLRWYNDFTDKWFQKVQEVRFVPRREFFVIVSYQPPDCRRLTSKGWSGRRSIQKHEEYLDEINRLTRTVVEELNTLYLQPRVLKRREFRNLIYSHLNPTQSEYEPEAPPSEPGREEAATLAKSSLKVKDSYVLVDQKYVGCQYLQQVPFDASFGWLIDLVEVNAEFSMSMFIHCCDQEKAAANWQGWQTIESIVEAKRKGRGSLDLAALEFPEQDDSWRDMYDGSHKFFDVSVYLKTYAESADRLGAQMEEVRKAFKSNNATLDRGQMLQLESWQSTLPVGVDKLAQVHRLITPLVGSLFPLYDTGFASSEGVAFGLSASVKPPPPPKNEDDDEPKKPGLLIREPTLFNPFGRDQIRQNGNMLVFGAEQAGKSFAAGLLVMRLLPIGSRFVVLDSSRGYGPYRFITELLGQDLCEYVDSGRTEAKIVNPFDYGPNDRVGDPSEEKLIFLVSWLELILSGGNDVGLSQDERAILDSLVRVVYMDAGMRGAVPVMSDLVRTAKGAAGEESNPWAKERLEQFAKVFSFYARGGPYGALFDGLTNIDLECPLIVFNTKGIAEPVVERILQLSLLEFSRRKAMEAKERGLRFACVLDEFHSFMSYRAGCGLVYDFVKRSSTLGHIMILLSSKVKELLAQPEFFRSIAQLCAIRVLMRQPKEDLLALKDPLGLNKQEYDKTLLFERVETDLGQRISLFKVGVLNGLIKIMASPLDYWLLTTKPTDLERRAMIIQDIKEKNPQINHTDACRQAAYFLALQQDS